MKLSNRVALITGGGRGIGRAVAMAYAREGAKVAICARTAAEIEKAVADIRALGDCEGWVCDVSSEESVKEFVTAARSRFGDINVLVNNAGVMIRPAPVTSIDIRKWDYTMAVNVRGVFLVTQAVLPMMIKQKSGAIINLSSDLGRGGYANFAAYATSKWAVEGFTQTLAAEVRPYNIRANTVSPGVVATKMTGYSGSEPESVTDLFVYLASDESKGITGKMLDISHWKSQLR
ncbi:MAG: SDR family oxidoreductase [Acidobacteria bacterium]|nr:SDR family oxidoreductase [Acidobacteriota bacterium]